MYQIDPNRAMTEMFGVGKGEAQVFDNTQAERGIQMGIKLREQRQQEEIAKAKANKAKYEEVSKQAIGQVHPSDIGQFNKMMGGYRQEVYDAYLRGGGELSIDDQLKLQQKFGEINQLALNSKAKFDANKSLLANIENSKEPFRDRELAKAYEQASKPSFDEKTGQWNFDTVKGITPVYDLSKDIDTAAKERANWLEKNQEQYNRKSWTIEQSAADVENLFKGNAVARKELYEQMLDMNPNEFKDLVNSVYNSPKDDYGYKNTSYKGNVDVNKITPDNVNIDDVAKYMYTNRFYADAAGFAPSAYASGGALDKSKTDIIYDPNEGTLDFNPPGFKKDLPHDLTIEGKVVRFKAPRATVDASGNVTGVTYTKIPTERQQQDNRVYISAQEGAMKDELEFVSDPKKREDIIKKYQGIIAKVPYPEEIVTVKNPDVADLMVKQAYNLSPKEVIQTGGAGQNFQVVESTQAKNIDGVTYLNFNEYYEKNKTRARREELRDEWQKGMQFKREQKAESPSAVKYTDAQEKGIATVMSKNGITRDAAIKALQAAGKLK